VARGKETSPEVRAAVTAALLAGQGVCEVATQFNLDKSIVSRIRAALGSDQLQRLATKKQIDFGELLAGYLEETIITLQAQAKFFRDETWLSKQPASDLAILHGVAADKAIRLLEAIERANSVDSFDMDSAAGATD
jgi:transposase-like protein